MKTLIQKFGNDDDEDPDSHNLDEWVTPLDVWIDINECIDSKGLILKGKKMSNETEE